MLIVWDEEAPCAKRMPPLNFTNRNNPAWPSAFWTTLMMRHRESRIARISTARESNIRKCKLPHFPYALIYRIQTDSIQIIAVMHLRQAPGYWKRRT
jgi:hypothetical protein